MARKRLQTWRERRRRRKISNLLFPWLPLHLDITWWDQQEDRLVLLEVGGVGGEGEVPQLKLDKKPVEEEVLAEP